MLDVEFEKVGYTLYHKDNKNYFFVTYADRKTNALAEACVAAMGMRRTETNIYYMRYNLQRARIQLIKGDLGYFYEITVSGDKYITGYTDGSTVIIDLKDYY